MVKAKQLPSGSWNVLVYAGLNPDGTRSYESFTDPDKTVAEFKALEFKLNKKRKKQFISLGDAIDEYIAARDQILSPTTIAGYKSARRNYFKNIMDIPVRKLTREMIQAEANREAMIHSPKTLRNAYGLIHAVMRIHNPSVLRDDPITLPAKKKKRKELPEPIDVLRVIRGSSVELPVFLASWLSLRMSEVRGIKYSDIKDGYLTINQVVVYAERQQHVRDVTKTPAGDRRLRVPPYIQYLISQTDHSSEFIITDSGQAIYKRFCRLLEKNGLPHMTFHDLRHLNASIMAMLDIPEKYAMERGGWASPTVYREIYSHTFNSARNAVDDKIDAYLDNIVQETEPIMQEHPFAR